MNVDTPIPLSVVIQEAEFDIAALQQSLLRESHQEGAVATFTGYVRVNNDDRSVNSLELEHYPGMTEKSIGDILHEACDRWPVLAAGVVHRVGLLQPGDPIVWVGISSMHREAAFSACEFVMDYLKTRAPFWKKERGPEGDCWVDAREGDRSRADRW
ncbi:MAG: molybdopterin synthase catalytic subunit MoaE [Halioglobus sp.]